MPVLAVVEYGYVLTELGGEWEDAVLDAVAAASSSEVSVRLAPKDYTSIDMLILLYEAQDHDHITKQGALRKKLEGRGDTVDRILLVGCGRRRPPVTDADVKQLALNQGSEFQADPRRVDTPAALSGLLGEKLARVSSGAALREHVVDIDNSVRGFDIEHEDLFSVDELWLGEETL
uniref:hypothetical protein n=1 Tax=Pseudoclavibacter sp. RFBI5 TaxID=2080578 RepID=UPI0011B02065|nr:hypothetical protein [Pseudoclavibacter sp. RFBI5]